MSKRKLTPSQKLAYKIIDNIIKQRLFKVECAHNENHSCIIVWDEYAADKIASVINNKEPVK